MRHFFKIFISILSLAILAGCSLADGLFEEDVKWTDQSNIDFLVGVEESGRLKRESHFSSTNDFDVDSDISFIYDGTSLIEKVFKNYSWGDPVIMQRDTFIYKSDELTNRIHYLRIDSPENPLELSKTYQYYYPDENTKVKVINQYLEFNRNNCLMELEKLENQIDLKN